MASGPQAQQESLEHRLEHTLEEARMLLPGIQALFGFQLIAVFSDGFQRLGVADRLAHLVAIGLSVSAVMLLLAPAAYHRQCEPGMVSTGFLIWAGRALAVAMAPLGAALCLDLEVVGTAVLGTHAAPVAMASAAALACAGLWFVLPLRKRAHVRHEAERRRAAS